jgi:ABC-type antimicrobial peptide transport system ATPase subunit
MKISCQNIRLHALFLRTQSLMKKHQISQQAPVTSFLLLHQDTLFSFMGNSSTGKSTAAALAVSIAGNPSKGDQTLFRGWNGTRNAIEGYLSNNFGIFYISFSIST